MKRLLALPFLLLLAAPAAAFDENDPVAKDLVQIMVMKAFVTHVFDVCDEQFGPNPAYAAAKADWLAHNADALALVEAVAKKTGKVSDDDRKSVEATIFKQVEGNVAGDPAPEKQCKSIAAAVTGRDRDIEDFPGGPDIIARLKKV